MANPIVLVPARMSSTRLPGKPLADIWGEPMIVHVWRRAIEADVGPVLVAADDARIVEAVTAAGGRAVLTRPDHGSGSDRIFEALGGCDPEAATTSSSISRAICRRSRAAVRAAVGPLADPDVDIATLATEIKPRRGARRPQRRQGGRDARRAGPAARALFHPRDARRGARGRCCTTSASTPIGAPRWRVSSRCRPRRSSGARSSNNCGRWRRACASTSRWSTSPRSASTRRKTCVAPAKCWRRKERHDRQDHRLSGRTGRQFAHRLPRRLPRLSAARLRHLRGRVRRAAGRERRAGDDPDREFDRRPGRRHPRPAAGLRPAHHRRDLPADPLPVARRAGRDARNPAHRPQPRPRARPVPQDHPQARPDAGRRQRHRRLGARGGGSARPRPAPRSPPSSPARSTA